MQIRFQVKKEISKVISILILLGLACFLTYYFHVILRTGTVFTHFFYIPIILSSLWWKRKGLVIAIFLASLLIFSHIFLRINGLTVNDYFRALMFIFISLVVARLSEHIDIAEEQNKLACVELNQIFNASGDGMRVIDKDFNVLKINDTFSNISHISKKEAVGKKCYELLSSSRCHTSKCPLTQILCGESCVKDDVDEKRKDGEITPCFVTATPFRDPDGSIMGIVENLQDISELKRDEQALRISEKRLRFLSSQLLKIQEKERKRIARELHDGIGQLLNTIKYSVENVLSHKGRTRPSSAVKTLGAVNPIIQNSIEEVRRICTDLRPPILDDLGILATISSFCREFNTIYPDIYIEKKVSIQEDEIPDILKTDIYRIMQEAFNNIAKYSKADFVSFFLKKINGSIELTIQDNGLGFDLEAACSKEYSQKGFGLTSMRERTELSGGFFSIKSISGDGTIIHASWPCERKDPSQN